MTAFLLSELSGYIISCIKRYEHLKGYSPIVYHWPAAKDAPFDKCLFDQIQRRFERTSYVTALEIIKELRYEGITTLVISGWMDNVYLEVARVLKKRGVNVIASSDTQWTGSCRQILAGLVAPFWLHKRIDKMWVTGDRQLRLAKALGYSQADLLTGFYSCDWDTFQNQSKRESKSFLYVGRLISRKGINDLLQAYCKYREKTIQEPWELIIAGTGSLDYDKSRIKGVTFVGFVQPIKLPHLLTTVGCFILPSHFEPWGVSLHEAVSASLPVIVSSAVGAGDHLVENGQNGFVFNVGNVSQLCERIQDIAESDEELLEQMGRKSYEISMKYTPYKWAQTLMYNE